MNRGIRKMGFAAAAALAIALLGAPASNATLRIEGMGALAPATPTTISITGASVSGSAVAVSGTLSLGSDALGAYAIDTDPSGDASPAGLGLDLGNVTVTPDLVKKTLTFDLALNDAVPTGGTAPATGVGVPIVIDGEDQTYWLGAGNVGSNGVQSKFWTGLCNNVGGGGWNCTAKLAGSADTARIEWVLPFSKVPPGIAPGSVVENDGGSYSGTPASFFWPSEAVTYGLYTADTVDVNGLYLVPGGVKVAITPEGVAPGPNDFKGSGAYDAVAGTFTGSIAKPATAGSYTVTVKSCFGDSAAPTCVTASSPLTV